ncbi:MAG: hypothetical protein P4L93_11760 [Coriobacteriia bacterium]|nr:hypothetical protein [Coriobacteriia bacterium]
MRTLRTLGMAAAAVALLLAAGCSSTASTTTSEATSTLTTATAAAVPTAPVGPMLGSNATTMPDVIGLNLRIAAERFTSVGSGARIFTDNYHGVWAKDVYGETVPSDLGDPVVTTTSPAAGSLLHGDNLYIGTGPLAPRKYMGKTIGPWFFVHGPLVKRVNDQGCWGCHAPQFCQRCHNGYKVGTAGMTHPPVTVESVSRNKIAALFPDKKVSVTRVVVNGTDGYAVYLTYTDPASATSVERGATEGKLATAIADAKLSGVGSLTVIWMDSTGQTAAIDKVPLR